MTLLDHLKEDHDTVRNLIEDLKRSFDNNQQKIKLFNDLAEEVIIHTKAEETAFYDPLMEKEQARLEILESTEEHALVSQLIEQLQVLALTPEEWNAKCKTLCKLLLNHLNHEEKDAFTLAEKVFTKDKLEELSKVFENKKAALRS